MTLRAIESFDYLTPGVGSTLNNPQLSALGWYQFEDTDWVVSSVTRFGYGYSLKPGGVDNDSTIAWLVPGTAVDNGVIGWAWMVHEAAEQDNCYIAFADGDAVCLYVRRVQYGVVEIWLGTPGSMGSSMIFQSDPGVWRNGVWDYWEIKFLLDNDTITPAGTVELRINTVPIADYINVTTAPPGSTTWNNIKLGMDRTPFDVQKRNYYDDFYVLNTDGADTNDFLGNVRVQGIKPAAPGVSTQWFPSNGMLANWQNASNSNVDDSLYVYTPNIGDLDLYEINPIINAAEVYGVAVKGAYRQDDATQRFVNNVLRTGGVNFDGTVTPASSNYNFVIDVFQDNPDTGMSWTDVEVNLLQIGPKVDS